MNRLPDATLEHIVSEPGALTYSFYKAVLNVRQLILLTNYVHCQVTYNGS
jgi:hypothetical protein